MIEWHGTDRISLGQRIAAARTRVGMGQNALARGAGIGPGVLNDIERGRTPCPASLLVRLAEELGVPFRELRGEAPAP